MIVTHLNKHVIYDKEKVDSFRGHDKDVETTSRLVETHTLKLAAELERSWKKHCHSQNISYGASLMQLVYLYGLTCGCGLQYEGDNAKKVDICIIHSELHKECLGVHIKPGVIIKVLEDSISTWIKT